MCLRGFALKIVWVFCLFLVLLAKPANIMAAADCPFPRFQVGSDNTDLAPWVPREGDILMRGLRSNAKHYWSWAHQFSASGKSVLRQEEQTLFNDLVRHRGIIEGDAHQENYGWLRSEPGADPIYGPNDRDDWGIGPFLLSYAKFLGVTESVVEWAKSDGEIKEKKLKKLIDKRNTTLLEAYKNGLAVGLGKKSADKLEHDLTDFLQKQKSKAQEKMDSEYYEYIEDRVDTEGKKFLYGEKGLQDPRELSPGSNAAWIFNEALNVLNVHLDAMGFRVHDIAWRTKTDAGGSQGMVRILFYVDRGGRFELIEFKQQVGTSLDQFQEQGELLPIMQAGKEIYWGGKPFPLRQDIAVNECLFFTMRPLEPSFNQLEVKPEKKDELDTFLDLSFYQAQEMGRKHGVQLRRAAEFPNQVSATEAYYDLIDSRFDEVKDLLKEMTRLYLRVAQRNHSK